MSAESQNHYQVLRIERTVDERAIKKAYFTLIREFPPDKHPEEFKKIREAYEVLSDPVARQRFDAADKDFEEYGDELAERLRAVEEKVKAGNDAEAQAALTALLEEHPTLTVARENLAFSYMRTGAHEEALKQWRRLSKDAPDEPRYHFHKGITLNRLDQADKALLSVKKAHELKPEELRFHLAFIDLLLGKRALDEALREIEEAIEQQGEDSDQAMSLRLRRLDGLFSIGSLAEAQEDATEFFERVRKLADPEAPKYFSSQLAGVAAKLFARDEAHRANAVLERCKELNPASLVDHPYPTSAALRLQDLPPEAADWLSLQAPGPTSPTLEEGVWAKPIFSLLLACFGLALFLYLLFEEPMRWTAASLVFTALALAALGAALAYVLRTIWSILESPIRGMVTVHPLYLVRARADRLTVYPLVRLTKTHGVHQHTNGGYTHTSVTLHFGTETVELTIRGKEYAQGWLDYFVNRRRRALELMAEGYLEAEQGVEMIPPALLTKPPASRAQQWARAQRWYGAAAVAVVTTLAVLVPLRAARADDYAYRLAVRAQPEPSYTTYLAEYPEGRHATEVKRALDLPHAAAVASFKALFLGSEKRGASTAIPAALEILRAAGVTTVPVTILSKVDLSPLSQSDRKEATSTFGATLIAARESALLSRMRRIFEAAGVGAVMQLKPATEWVGPEAPVTLTIRTTTTADGKLFESPGRPAIPSLQIAWEAVLSAKGSDTPLWRFETVTASPAELRFDRPEAGQTPRHLDRAMRRMELLGLDDFTAKMARELGLSGEPPTPRGTSQDAPERTTSPYER
jgi:curved DNA-binding protein CbpA